MSDISEQEASNTNGELNKALSGQVGKAERGSKIDTTRDEKDAKSVKRVSPSCEINAEDDLKTTILNLSKQIRELQQRRSSTSFQHHRFYSNPDPLRLKTDPPRRYHSYPQSTKHLKGQVYTKNNKNYSCFCSSS